MRSTTVILICSLLLVVIPFNTSANTQWSKINFGGGDVLDMVSFPSNPDIMLACVSDYGISRSDNRGESWSRIVSGVFYDISVSGDDTAYIAGETGVMISRDNGLTWNTCNETPSKQVISYLNGIIALAPIKKDTNYSPLPWELSLDSGVTWETWEGTGNTGSLLFLDSGVIYRSASYAMYRSEADEWNTWIQVWSGSFHSPAFRFGFIYNDSTLYAYSRYIDYHPAGYQQGGVFRSSDGGATWLPYTDIGSVSAMEISGDKVLIGTPEGSLFTVSLISDELKTIGTFGGEVTAIDTKRFGSGELIVSTKGGIFKTSDGGLNWHKSDSGLLNSEITAVQTVPIGIGGERIVMSTKESGIFYSDDSGINWTWADPDVRTIPGLMRVSESYPKLIYTAESYICVSRDNGISWERIEQVPLSYYGWYSRATDIEIDPLDPDRIVVNYFCHSLDDYRGVKFFEGRFYLLDEELSLIKWEWAFPLGYEGNYYRSKFSGDGELVWVSDTRNGCVLYALNKTGEIVRELDIPGSSDQYYWLIDGETCYVFCAENKRFWVSEDMGTNWEFTDMNINDYDYIHCIYPNSEGHLGDIVLSPDKKTLFLLYPGNGVLASVDKGRTWQAINEGLSIPVVFQLAFSEKNPGVIYAAAVDGLYELEGLPFTDSVKGSYTKPVELTLYNNSPNPFNLSTTIHFETGKSGAIILNIYNSSGQKIRELLNNRMTAGKHTAVWNGKDGDGREVSSGVYLIELKSGNSIACGKMLLMK